MILIPPIPHRFPEPTMSITRDITYNLPDIYDATTFEKPLTIINACKMGEILEIRGLPIDDLDAKKFFSVQNQVNHCVNNAEHLNSKLRDFFYNQSVGNPAAAKAILKKDFMSLRTMFSEYVKTFRPLRTIEYYNSKAKLSAITSVFFAFITQRNIYTHGSLLYLYNEDKLLLQYVGVDKLEYCEVTTEILLSFNNTFWDLNNFVKLVIHLTNDIENTVETEKLIKFCQRIPL